MKTLIILLFSSFLISNGFDLAGANPANRVVQTAYTVLYQSPSLYSSVTGLLEEGQTAYIISETDNWSYVQVNNIKGYVLKKSLSPELQKIDFYIYKTATDGNKADEMASNSRSFRPDSISTSSKAFGAEDIAATSKAFGAEDIAATSKAFDAEDIAATSKAFDASKQESSTYRDDSLSYILKKYYLFDKNTLMKREQQVIDQIKN